jgi:coproporphyrinogen III oxidase-like Fe-S oxidoreductase
MRRLGYSARPGGRFVLDPSANDRYKQVRSSLKPTLLGMGASAYSHGWGYFFRNGFSTAGNSSIRGYVDRIRAEGLAVESGLRLDAVETAAGELVAGVRSGVRLPLWQLATRTYLEQAAAMLRKLAGHGLVEEDGTGLWSLTERGALLEEEICSLFYSPAVRASLARVGEGLKRGRQRAFPSTTDREVVPIRLPGRGVRS